MALTFYTHGRATHVDRRSRYAVREGDVSLIPAGEPHRVDRASGAVAWGLGFCPTRYGAAEQASLLTPFAQARSGASPVISIPADRQQHLAYLMAELQRESAAERPHAEATRHGLLGLILTEIRRASTPITIGPHAADEAVNEALRFIEQRCLDPISLGDVAAAARRSPAHLTTALRKATGKSVSSWILAGRMAEARRRLAQTDERVEIIAERVGYADATHFIRLFKREHGATPAAWRAALR